MQNAHLRMGQLEYTRSTAKTETSIRLYVGRYVGEEGQAHLLSVFGGDAEVGAIAAAVVERHTFTLTFPCGKRQRIALGQNASCYRGSLSVPGRKQPLRHLLTVSEALHANGTAGRLFLLNDSRALAWATLVSLLGVPADPRWGEWTLDGLAEDDRIQELDGIGGEPLVIAATRDELMKRVASGIRKGALPFPETNGPIFWPQYRIEQALTAIAPNALPDTEAA